MNSDLELLRLKEAPEHLDEITKHHRAPNIIAEVETVGGFPAKRLCIGNIFMVFTSTPPHHSILANLQQIR
jgi:hypothetical protein